MQANSEQLSGQALVWAMKKALREDRSLQGVRPVMEEFAFSDLRAILLDLVYAKGITIIARRNEQGQKEFWSGIQEPGVHEDDVPGCIGATPEEALMRAYVFRQLECKGPCDLSSEDYEEAMIDVPDEYAAYIDESRESRDAREVLRRITAGDR